MAAGTDGGEIEGGIMPDMDSEPNRDVAVLFRDAEQHLAAGRFGDASRSAMRCAEFLRGSERDAGKPDDLRILRRVLLIQGRAMAERGLWIEVARSVTEAADLARDADDEADLAAALAALSRARCEQGAADEAMALATEVLSLHAAAAADVDVAGAALVAAAAALGRPSDAVATARSALVSKRRSGETAPAVLAAAEGALVHARLGAGDEAGALQSASRALLRLQKAGGDAPGQLRFFNMVADIHLQAGRVLEAVATARLGLASLAAGKSEEKPSADSRGLEGILARGLALMGEAKGDVAASEGNAGTAGVDQTDKVCLRSFAAEPSAGESPGGVTWQQTMGRLTVMLPLDAGSDADRAGAGPSVDVQLCTYQLQVLRGEKITALCGSLFGLVLPEESRWSLRTSETVVRSRGAEQVVTRSTLVISLAKKEHKAWPQLWHHMRYEQAHRLSAGRFSWTKEMYEDVQEIEELEAKLKPLTEGANPGSEAGFALAPDDLCVGLDVSQTNTVLTVRVHFDGEALRIAQRTVPLEDLLAADVGARTLCVFLRGDEQNPVLWARLGGTISPWAATWRITTSDKFRNRQRETSTPVPVLEFTLPKEGLACQRWPLLFSDCWQHRLMLKNYGELEATQFLLEDDAEARLEVEKLPAEDTSVGEPGDEPSVEQQVEDEAREVHAKREDIVARILDDEQREQLQAHLTAWKEERWEGLAGAKTFHRSNIGLQEPDFSAHVAEVVHDIIQRTGCDGPARWNPELGRYSYIY